MARALGTRSRFFLAYLALGAAVGSGIGAFIVLLERPGPKPAPQWSSWEPPSSSTVRATQQIASHVGRSYKLPSGHQLARIVIGAPGQAQNTVRAIGIPKILQPKDLGDFDLYDQSASVMYVLCGAGAHCKINEGEPTVARGTVLRREALELALYTLKYARPIDNVVVFFPPGPKQKRLTSALFVRRRDLSPELDRPLKTTLPQPRAPLPGKIDPAELRTVNALTGTRLYRYLGLANADNFGSVVVLQPTA
jgi:hypothetical protein